MSEPAVFLFSGHGSQYYGMGRQLYASHAVFRDALQTLDAKFRNVLRERLEGAANAGILNELYREDRTPADRFEDLRFTHPAIVMIELALLETLRAEGIEPDCVVGASLGGFAAAATAGVLTVDALVRCVVEQVAIVERWCPAGGMVAVFGPPETFETDDGLRAHAELAAVNADRHFVLSAPHTGLAPLEARLRAIGMRYQRLPVAYAFHSRSMEAAAEPFRRCVEHVSTRRPALPLVSCETAEKIGEFRAEHLWRMVRSPIRFREAIRMLEQESDDRLYVDLGPAGTLANFARQNRGPESRSTAVAVLDPFAADAPGLDRIKRAYDACAGGRVAGRLRRAHGAASSAEGSSSMKAYLFPGQGSQARGMGDALFAEFPDHLVRADEILGYSIAGLCRENPDGRLDRTEFTQPALFVVNALSYLKKAQANGRVAFLAGHSLGEYNALFAAQAFDFETGVRLVQKRAALMARVTGGGMAAVVGLDEETIIRVLAEAGHQEIDVANYNGARQFILSGPREAVVRTEPALIAAGARAVIPLRVSGAFHSRYMEPARQEFARFLAGFAFRRLSVPVIANVTGLPYDDGMVARLLAEQLTRPVRWDRTVQYLLAQGEIEFEELGPGKVLSTLVSKIRDARPAATVAATSPAARVPPPIAVRDAPPPPPGQARPEAPRQERAQPEGAATPAAGVVRRVDPCSLGSAAFRETYGTRFAYACGAMYQGTASEELVVQAARAGALAFFGTGGLPLPRIGDAIQQIQRELPPQAPYGMNLVHNPTFPAVEDQTVELFLGRGIRNLEASAFLQITPALVRYRLNGLRRQDGGGVEIPHRILGKLSRPEVADAFLAPAPDRIVRRLLALGQVTQEEADLAREAPMADDLCVEADSGGHTDRGNPLVLLPTMIRLRDRAMERHGYRTRVRVGAAGGIGTPEAAAAVFVLGADFILTGSINLCSVESGMSAVVKDMLQEINIQDTDYAPAGDMFEMGAQVQVLKRGVFFPARARKLYDLYRRYDSLDEIDAVTRAQIEERYFHKSFDEVWRETREYFRTKDPGEIEKAEQNPRHKMALVFRWYFGHSQRLAMSGREEGRVDFQVHCGPALGAFNQWVKGTPLESWRNRRVQAIAETLMEETARCLERRMADLAG